MTSAASATTARQIWFAFAGSWLALGYVLAGILCMLLIVTIPISLLPLGKKLVPTSRAFAAYGR